MTNLEAIALRLKEERDIRLEEILKISGSAAIAKNEYNVNLVDDTNPASSLVFKKLNKPKLDDERIVKAIDVELTELKPVIPVPVRDLVPKPLYDAEVATNEDLRIQVENLTNEVSVLSGTITQLEAELQSEINNRLSVEQTNDILVNQLETINKTIDEFSIQISTSLQKSVDESILRASLQSQNTGFKAQINALIKQIDSLNSIIEGLQSQLGAVQQQQAIQQSTAAIAFASGAEVINKVVAINITPKKQGAQNADIEGAINNKTNESKWIAGNTIDITNSDSKDVQIEITTTFGDNQRWFSVPKTNFTIGAGANEKLQLTITPSGCRYDKRDRSVRYDGILKIKVKRTSDNSEETKEYKLNVGILHPKSY
jgi:hypothetical protein